MYDIAQPLLNRTFTETIVLNSNWTSNSRNGVLYFIGLSDSSKWKRRCPWPWVTRALDMRSTGHGFNSHPAHCWVWHQQADHARVSVTMQYNLVAASGEVNRHTTWCTVSVSSSVVTQATSSAGDCSGLSNQPMGLSSSGKTHLCTLQLT